MERSKRRTIGVLMGFHVYEGARPAPFAFPLVRGMQAAARDKKYNLMVACGVARRTDIVRHKPAWPSLDSESDFVPVGPDNTDGLIFIGPLMTDERLEFARRLIDEGFPSLVIGSDAGYPAIVVDNEGGIWQALKHLIGHGHRSIAFIAGEKRDTGDSAARLQAYRNGVREFGLADDPRLVEYGFHWDEGGRDAMRRLLASGAKFSAVMCSNDLSALGAMQALREAGLRVPWDVAVSGFDDVLEVQAQIPPLTSIHYPLFETGYRSILLLDKRIARPAEALPDLTRVSTLLIPRQSCGCMPEIVARSADSDPGLEREPEEPQIWVRQKILEALLAENLRSDEGEFLPLCERLAEGFLGSMDSGDLHPFQNALIDVLQHIERKHEENAHIWQAAVTVLRRTARGMLAAEKDPARVRFVEGMLHQARTMLSESTERRYARLQAERIRGDEDMGLLTTRLISASDENQVYDVLREDLPRAGVHSCNAAFFEPGGADPVEGSVLRPLTKDASPIRFETRRFPPPGLYPDDSPFSLAVLPLYFRDEKLGYVAFDGGNLDPLATLMRQFSSSIKNAQLHAKVLELSLTDELTGVHNRGYFEIMLQKETERSRRYRRDLAVIMIDIDHFKRYNDAFGHPAGDEALREIARCLTRGARRDLDVVTRYGGEEFAIILPETDSDGAYKVAETVRVRVEENQDLLQPTTISLGVAAMRGEGTTAPQLVGRADRALYQAKHLGRNRTVRFEDWMPDSLPPGE
jgi:diguanylate cyclase (GGDEF)-like protein